MFNIYLHCLRSCVWSWNDNLRTVNINIAEELSQFMVKPLFANAHNILQNKDNENKRLSSIVFLCLHKFR